MELEDTAILNKQKKKGKGDYLYKRFEPKPKQRWREVQFASGMGQHIKKKIKAQA